jgi:hypothetical protein
MKKAGTTTPLLMIAALLVALVGADRFGWLPGRSGPEDDAADSPRARYLAAAATHEADRALIARAGQWRAAAADAQSRWDAARSRLVAAPTVELAESRLRELVLAALADLKIASPRVTYVKEPVAAGAEAAGRVRPIALRVEFDATNHRDAYLALDRVRHLPDAAVVISSLVLDGPGRAQLPEQMTVSITLRAAALVGGES